MLIGRIRPAETMVLEEGEQPPAGWEMLDPNKRIAHQVEPVNTIEAADLYEMRSKVPEGWKLLSVSAE